MTPDEVIRQIQHGGLDKSFESLYSAANVVGQRQRYIQAINGFITAFGGDRQVRLFSAPGRTEIGGNHTDHQHGRVLAAAVNLDVICIASTNEDRVIRLRSPGYVIDDVAVDSLDPKEGEKGTSVALIKGVASTCADRGYAVSGFDAFTNSDVLKGSGLSSSAAFEVSIGTMINGLFNQGRISAVEIAQISQIAENKFFGKPSGLMDQMASSVGGLVAINFADSDNPIIEPIAFDFFSCGYTLCIVDTKGDHADLTPDYAAIPEEMFAVAKQMGASCLGEVKESDFYNNIVKIRENCGDRAVMRAIHFFGDNKRVLQQSGALQNGDFKGFLNLIKESGRSSALYLQNIYSCKNPQEQGLSIALALCESILSNSGAWRVHGGGFAGTVQAFVPNSLLDEFSTKMDAVFGEGSCHKLMIRPVGGTEITLT